jgi:hypothetical protein
MIPQSAELYLHTAEEPYKIYLERRDLREFIDTSNIVERRYGMNSTEPDDVTR